MLVRTDIDDGVATVTLYRPDNMNAFNFELAEDLYNALREAAINDKVKLVILRGHGKTFCAGGDVKVMHESDNKPKCLRDMTQAIHKCVIEITSMKKPVISAIHGFAVGAGLGLALSCDIRIAVKGTKFNTGFLGIGLAPGCGTHFLTKVLPYNRAAELVFLSKPFTSHEALDWGLINHEVADMNEMEKKLEEYKAYFRRSPSVAVGMSKQLLQASYTNTLQEHLELESQTASKSAGCEDFSEGVKAFYEKRKPNFHGR